MGTTNGGSAHNCIFVGTTVGTTLIDPTAVIGVEEAPRQRSLFE